MGAASVVGEFVRAAGGGQVAQVAGGGRVGHAGLGGDVAGGGLAEPADRREDRLGGVGRGGGVLSHVRPLPRVPADGRGKGGGGAGARPTLRRPGAVKSDRRGFFWLTVGLGVAGRLNRR